MKKIIALALVAAMALFCLTACGEKKEPETTTAAETTVEETTTEEATTVEETTTEEATTAEETTTAAETTVEETTTEEATTVEETATEAESAEAETVVAEAADAAAEETTTEEVTTVEETTTEEATTVEEETEAVEETTEEVKEETPATKVVIGIPNDTTNEARALLLLESLGYIKLKEDAGITATIRDIEENPSGIEFKEVEAAQLPNVLQDLDFAVINSNYAIAAGIDPMTEALAMEGSTSAYANVLVVKEGNEEDPAILALKAALESQAVADFITEEYKGSVVSTIDEPTDGYNADIDYEALKGTKITIGASPAPHAEILKVVKDILAEKDITLDIQEFMDYVMPNTAVEDGSIMANYFQHVPYLDDFNAEQGTHLVAISAPHVEPMGIYGGKQTTLDVIK